MQCNDPLVWCKQNHTIYDNLSLLAKYYVAIPVMSGLYECCFLAAGRLLSSLRAGRMYSDTFEDTYIGQVEHAAPPYHTTEMKEAAFKIIFCSL